MVWICLDLLPSPIESSRQFAAPWASRPCIASSHSQWCHSRKWHGSAFMSQVPFMFRNKRRSKKRATNIIINMSMKPIKKNVFRENPLRTRKSKEQFSPKWEFGRNKWWFDSYPWPLAPRKPRRYANLWDLRSLWWRSPLKKNGFVGRWVKQGYDQNYTNENVPNMSKYNEYNRIYCKL